MTSAAAPAPEARSGVRAVVRPKDNPFTSQRIHALAWRPPPEAAPPEDPPPLERLAARLGELGGRGALVGPHGHGKSTLLAELGDHLARRSPELVPRRLTAGPDRPLSRAELGALVEGLTPRHLLLVDGFDHLPPWSRWRILRAARLTARPAARPAAALVVTCHRVTRPGPGRLPTLLHCTTTPALLADLVDELLDGAPPPVPLPSADDLHRRHAGNLRDALHELYDRCAGRLR